MAALQVRNVPEEVHETLRRRSVREGISLSEYVLRVLSRESANPTMTEWLATLPAPGTLDVAVTGLAATGLTASDSAANALGPPTGSSSPITETAQEPESPGSPSASDSAAATAA